jgi:hypothetical protein
MSDSDSGDMERGIAQVMNRLAPGAVFTYAGTDMSMQVTDWQRRPLEGVNKERVADHLAGRVEGFRNADRPRWADIRERDMDFFRPIASDDDTRSIGVMGEFFPLTAVCRECDAVTHRNSPRGLRHTDGRCPSGSCNGGLQQLQFALVHECGALTNITPSGCPNHGQDAVYLKKGSPEEMRTWAFRCRRCSAYDESLNGPCSECGDFIPSATPLQAGSVYYPQRDSMVEIPPLGLADDQELPYGEPWARVLIAGFLGEPDFISEGVLPEEVALHEGMSTEDIQGFIDQGVDRDTLMDILESASPGGGYSRNAVTALTEDRLDLPTGREWYTLVSHQLFTFLRCTSTDGSELDSDDDLGRQPSSTSLASFIHDDSFTEKHPEARFYRQQLSNIGVADAWVIDNFPLLNLLFGYSRGTPTAGETDLRHFDHPYDASTLTVYGDRSPSEAIVLELDRAAIIRWLIQDGPLDRADAPDLEDESALKQWFLENIDPRQTQDPFTSMDDGMTAITYRLIHSMSHALMRNASDQCGLGGDSISEMILPNVPAIILYASSMKHFALGGMFTLFKTRINDWVEDTREFTEQCIYDPACRTADRGAACHACLHVSEFNCEYFNEQLDRRLLVGDDAEGIGSFWDMD